MKKAAFLDRDGVINLESGSYTTNVDDFIINKDIPEAIKILREKNYLVIVITNQGGIAKKLYKPEDVLEMHIKLCEELSKTNTDITDIYFCPHHEVTGKCLCRKPNSLMLEKAISTYEIDVKKSFLIGDSDRDILAAENVGIRGIKIESNKSILNLCEEIVKNETC